MILIKTALDFVESDDSNYILLGSWCLKPQDILVNDKSNIPSIKYHWDDRLKFQKDYHYLSQVYENLLKNYVDVLLLCVYIDNNSHYQYKQLNYKE